MSGGSERADRFHAFACARSNRAPHPGRVPRGRRRQIRLSSNCFGANIGVGAWKAPALIVVPPVRVRFGNRVTALASRARVPVLVERGAGRKESVLAATDLEDARYPVLAQAASLSRQLDVPLVTLHNLNPKLGLCRMPLSNAA